MSTIGVPSGGFGILNPGAYASLFLGQRAAIEPQLGLIWITDGDDSEHFVHFAGQFDYFVQGTGTSSPYIFASAGVFGSSDEYNPSYSAGGGYRIRAGDRLAFRVDGRYTRFGGDADGNALAFTLSIGGIFGQ